MAARKIDTELRAATQSLPHGRLLLFQITKNISAFCPYWETVSRKGVTGVMKICFFAEGSYPYVVGGVSAWIDMMIRKMPQHEFIVQTITVSREDAGKFKYELPGNLTAIHESFLLDNDIVPANQPKFEMTPSEKDTFRSFVNNENVDWEGIFKFFITRDVSVNDFVMGKDFLDIITEFCDGHYTRVVFSDFLWTYRSMMTPLCILLKTRLPQADVYHSVSTGYAGILAAMAKYQHKKPFLLSEHGIYTREREEDIIRSEWTQGVYKDIWIRHFYKLSECAYDRADAVTSLFGDARDLQVEIGCPLEKTLIIANGIDIEHLSTATGKDPGDTNINLGIVARVTPIKDIKTLITAFSYAKEKVPKLKLYIMGPCDEDVDYYEECVELIESLGVQDVEFTGRVNVREYIGKMDFSILTSISEGQPLSVLEFMAAGKPCIATKVGSCEEIILGKGEDPEPCGIITPVINVTKIAEAIVTLATDPGLRKKMGEVGLKRVKELYDDKIFLEQFGILYRELHSGERTGNPPEAAQSGSAEEQFQPVTELRR